MLRIGRTIITLFFASLACINWAQTSSLLNSYIIEADDDFDVKNWAANYPQGKIKVRPIFKKLNYWRVDVFQEKSIQQETFQIKAAKTSGIQAAFKNIKVKSRARPNDPMYADQWSKSLIELEKVWDITTGGTSANGHEIVVAVIDDGYDITHVDILENLWTNKGEIEDNGIDDDDNGYVDDFNGLHLPSQTDDHVVNSHGMGVIGLLGAQGNNNEGISGVNWNIKMMLMSLLRTQSSAGGSVSDVIEGLGYALDQRERFNQSDGQEGAFVVAVNWSGGVPDMFPADFPLWCTIYDELGKVGIINVQAVPNDNVNIEATGDMPSLCDSEFMLTVTNTDIADRKIESAAFGNVSVDIGAPGEDALSLSTMNRYRPFNGTSSATPQVAGVIALLYSLPCPALGDLIQEDPEGMARKIKAAVLNGGVPLDALSGITVTGARLDAYNSFLELEKAVPVITNCPDNITLREDESTYTWDPLEVEDDCGSINIESNIESGSEFRFGTTEVIISARDLVGNMSQCRFEVTREGNTDKPVSFVQLSSTVYSTANKSLFIDFETGSFETHIIDIYNMSGQLLRRTSYTPASSSVNQVEVKNLNFATGPYFVVINKAGGSIQDSKPFLVAN